MEIQHDDTRNADSLLFRRDSLRKFFKGGGAEYSELRGDKKVRGAL